MKSLYGLLIISFISPAMLRPARPSRAYPARSYSSRTSFQIKITNPKLLASLEAARQNAKAANQPEQTIVNKNKGPLVRSQGNSSIGTNFRSSQPSLSHTYTPSRITPADIVAHTAADITEGYLTYKAYQKIDETFFESRSYCPVPQVSTTHDEADDESDHE